LDVIKIKVYKESPLAYFDFPLEKLHQYKPARAEPDDFEVFWQTTLDSSRAKAEAPAFNDYESFLKTVSVYDVSYSGFDGQKIKAWYLLPRDFQPPLPCVVEYIGYGGGRSFPTDWLVWSAAGYASLIVDSRGQGSNKKHGDTPDVESLPSNVQSPGFLTRGILDPNTYYYRRVFTDAVLAIDAVKTRSEIDPDRIVVTGRSQGGGIALAVAGLSKDVAVTMPDVPFLCHYERAMTITDTHPYRELVVFCKTNRGKVEQVNKTLSYFDGVNFAAHANAQAYFSVALMDRVCPPSTVFAAYNHFEGQKQIEVYPYNEHEGGEAFQQVAQLKYLHSIFSKEEAPILVDK
jgi:cephalosporin-C deacetylase